MCLGTPVIIPFFIFVHASMHTLFHKLLSEGARASVSSVCEVLCHFFVMHVI